MFHFTSFDTTYNIILFKRSVVIVIALAASQISLSRLHDKFAYASLVLLLRMMLHRQAKNRTEYIPRFPVDFECCRWPGNQSLHKRIYNIYNRAQCGPEPSTPKSPVEQIIKHIIVSRFIYKYTWILNVRIVLLLASCVGIFSYTYGFFFISFRFAIFFRFANLLCDSLCVWEKLKKNCIASGLWHSYENKFHSIFF